jgi:hypothetical protein
MIPVRPRIVVASLTASAAGSPLAVPTSTPQGRTTNKQYRRTLRNLPQIGGTREHTRRHLGTVTAGASHELLGSPVIVRLDPETRGRVGLMRARRGPFSLCEKARATGRGYTVALASLPALILPGAASTDGGKSVNAATVPPVSMG